MNKNITNEKIVKLEAKSKDRSLSRAERQEILEELNWEKFRADPRPAMPLKKFKLLDALVYFGDAFIFGYMGILDNFGKMSHKGFHATDYFFMAMMALLIILVIVYLNTHSKYKIEPMDELAHRSMSKATNLAFTWLIFIGFAVVLVLSFIKRDSSISIKTGTLIPLFCSVTFLYSFFSNLIFVYLESRGSAGEEEE